MKVLGCDEVDLGRNNPNWCCDFCSLLKVSEGVVVLPDWLVERSQTLMYYHRHSKLARTYYRQRRSGNSVVWMARLRFNVKRMLERSLATVFEATALWDMELLCKLGVVISANRTS